MYISSLSDEERLALEPTLKAFAQGRARRIGVRTLLDAALYILRTGAAWRMLPREYPAWNTVYRQFRRWSAAQNLTIDVTSPPLGVKGTFTPMPLRWRIEQYFSWLFRYLRLTRNHCTTAAGFLAEISHVLVAITLRRYCKHPS